MPQLATIPAALVDRVFDVLVVGGGITGAGIARDAALRGLTVALIDKGDFASGTSCRSSRLVHGGVRYLEHGHLKLVFEASAERRRLLRLAPHLVHPLAFSWPVYEGQRLPLWKLAAGLTLYDALSMFRNIGRHRRLSAEKLLSLEPRLSARGLKGGVRYFDASTDDARLTLANVLDAERLGAVVANHVALIGVDARARDERRVARIESALTGDRAEVRWRVIVNATGPWSDGVRALLGGTPASRVQGSKGSHILVSRERVGNRDAITLLHPRDGRVMFALPGGGASGAHTIVGTTDSYTGVSPDEVRASESDVAYLLEGANAVFRDANLGREDVISAWSGIRPLVPTTGSSVAASREHSIEQHDSTVTITGGKLTTYRVMARQVVDVVAAFLGRRGVRSGSGERALPDDGAAIGALRASDPGLAAPLATGLRYSLADARWALEREHVGTLGDLLIRRTHVAFETRDNGRSAARAVIQLAASVLGWDQPRQTRELARYDAETRRIFAIDA